MSNESENRIDLTQFEGITEGSWLERTGGNMARWIVRGQFLENDANEALICAAPDLLAELKRCYYLIAKMQESIVKTIGECWVCGDYIDSCDSNTCERQILEDIELGTASE